MPRLKKSVPSYRLHKASDQAVVTLDGRDFYLGPWRSKASRIEYDRLISEWLANGRRVPSKSSDNGTVEDLLAAFWLHAKSYYQRPDGTPTTEIDAYKQAMKPVRRLYGQTLIGDFGPMSLKAIRQTMIDAGRARIHINHQINRIRRIFKWGVENELVPVEVLQALQAVAGLKKGRSEAREGKEVKPVPDAHVDAIRPFVSAQIWAMIELQRLSGMRSGEVTAMRGSDLNMSGSIWEYRPPAHKMSYRGHERIIYLGPKAQEVIKPFLKVDLQAYLFSPRDAEAERNAIRRANRKTPMTPSQAKRKPKSRPKRQPSERYEPGSYGRAVVYGITKAGVPHWFPHQLRHNAATRIRREFGLETAQVVLGHKTADVTQIYAEVDQLKAAEVMGRVG